MTAWTVLGDPTEAAVEVAARKAGIDLDAASNGRPGSTSCPSTRAASE